MVALSEYAELTEQPEHEEYDELDGIHHRGNLRLLPYHGFLNPSTTVGPD